MHAGSATRDPSKNITSTRRTSVAVFDTEAQAMGLLFYKWSSSNQWGDWVGFHYSYDGVALIAERGLSGQGVGYRIMALDVTGDIASEIKVSNYRRLVHGWEVPVSPRDPPGSQGWGESPECVV
jgi:hypothetical protein